MFVTRRRPGEAVRIGPEVRVVVVDVIGGQVRLAIEAPKSLPITREPAPDRENQGVRP